MNQTKEEDKKKRLKLFLRNLDLCLASARDDIKRFEDELDVKNEDLRWED